MSNKILIVASNYYEEISNQLLLGATNTLIENKCVYEIINAPGCFEIPYLIKKNHSNFSGFVALGCIIKGETYHFELIANDVSRKIMDVSLEIMKPIGFGVLTCYNYEQAKARSNIEEKNKGREAALACVELMK